MLLSFGLACITHHYDIWFRSINIGRNRENTPKRTGEGDIAGSDWLRHYLRGYYWDIKVSIRPCYSCLAQRLGFGCSKVHLGGGS